jgi:uncharacterized LabA/DUF88 family protein
MKRIGVFVDISNIYYCAGKKFSGRKVDYGKYLALAKQDGEVFRAIAYGAQRENEAVGFITCLRHLGFETQYKEPKQIAVGDKTVWRADWKVGITVDVVQMLDRLDLVVLGSADADMAPLVKYIRQKGIPCVILACGISRDLKSEANRFIELDETVLEQAA